MAVDPAIVCFQGTGSRAVSGIIQPEIPGTYEWTWQQNEGASVDLSGKTAGLSWEGSGSQRTLSLTFTAEGASEVVYADKTIYRCSLEEDDPGGGGDGWVDPEYPPPPYYPYWYWPPYPEGDEPATNTASPGEPFYSATYGSPVAVNNDDDDCDGILDSDESEDGVMGDNDLYGCYLYTPYTGGCCPCPMHNPEVSAVQIEYLSSKLRIWDDAAKNVEAAGVNSGQEQFIEGVSPSTSVEGERMILGWTEDDEHKAKTNNFTVFSLRMNPDVDLDGDVDTNDITNRNSLAVHGWMLPVASNSLRKLQLRSDVLIPGNKILSLSGDAGIRIWNIANPSTNDTPLLIAGQTITNGVDGVSFGDYPTSMLYVEAIDSGTATLKYSYVGTGDAQGYECVADMGISSIRFRIVPDWDCGKSINADDRAVNSTTNVFRFWINDDDDTDDISRDDSDLPGQGSLVDIVDCDDSSVNGRCDLLDFFPIHLDISGAVSNFPPASGYQYKLSNADEAIRFVYTDLDAEDAGLYLVEEGNTYGINADQNAYEADTIKVTEEGTIISSDFLTLISGAPERGVLLVEGIAATTEPLVLQISLNGTKVCSARFQLSITGVEEMYRWINIRGAAGGSESRVTDTDEPSNMPDAECNGKQFVFVHGYSVHEESARAWNSEMFKRLYQSGSKAMFTALTWYGNEGQISDWSPIKPGATPDYYSNVENAFNTASNLAAEVAALPGTQKYIAGHSLGNMITSSAIADHGLQVEQYFMLNAAVAMEVYNNQHMSIDAMRPDDWDNYTNRVWASYWYELFPSTDARHTLTWQNRFSSISNAVNYYSSTEDVLENGMGDTPTIGRVRAWVNQEMRKGITLIWLGPGNEEGGWGKNIDYLLYSMDTINNLPDATIQTNSVFCSFDEQEVYGTNGSTVVSNPLMRAQLLADAIPALSNPAGRNSLTGSTGLGDVNYMTNPQRNHGFRRGLYEDGEWPREYNEWRHSDIKNIAYPYIYRFFDDLIVKGGLDD